MLERLKGVVIGIILTLALMTAIPATARVTQETITVNFNNIRVAVNEQHVNTEFEPFIFQGRTYLPVRDVADAMGFDATWEDATNTVHLTARANVVPNYPPHRPAQTPAFSPSPSPMHSPSPQFSPSPSPMRSPSPQFSPNPSPGGNQGGRPSNPAISLDRAIEIAYADLSARGISATFRANSGMDWERGQWVWELEFRPNGQRGVIEYYINVNTGAIVKFEWDR
ncbi:MAG: stalk domain-containing protein [Defluviitaleaceae bacterium]|nr:stalk domain-containing protein [Defluviitaleaceae bacterium]